MNNLILIDALRLSRDSIATLAGKALADFEARSIQLAFIFFIDSHAHYLATLAQAWNAFAAAGFNHNHI